MTSSLPKAALFINRYVKHVLFARGHTCIHYIVAMYRVLHYSRDSFYLDQRQALSVLYENILFGLQLKTELIISDTSLIDKCRDICSCQLQRLDLRI